MRTRFLQLQSSNVNRPHRFVRPLKNSSHAAANPQLSPCFYSSILGIYLATLYHYFSFSEEMPMDGNDTRNDTNEDNEGVRVDLISNPTGTDCYDT